MHNKLEDCINALRVWMNKNRLKLNEKKTEFIIFGTSTGLKKVAATTIRVGQEAIPACDKVRNIGAMFDSEIKMDTQVTACVRARGSICTRLEKSDPVIVITKQIQKSMHM